MGGGKLIYVLVPLLPRLLVFASYICTFYAVTTEFSISYVTIVFMCLLFYPLHSSIVHHSCYLMFF